MKFEILQPRHSFIVIILFIFCLTNGFAQDDQKPPAFCLGIGLTPSLSQINNHDIKSGSNPGYLNKFSLSGSLEIGYFFTKNIGLISGLNYSSYNTHLSLVSYNNQLIAVDQENENYEMRVTGNNIEENQHIGVLGIPICLYLRIPLRKQIGIYVQPGINLAIPTDKNYESGGTFTYSGFFPAYNVLLKDLPEYGFPSNVTTTVKGDLKLKPILYFVMASAGFEYIINNRFHFSAGACFNLSPENISEYIQPDNFQLTKGANQLNSLMEGSSKVILQSLGINFGIRYFITGFEKNKYPYKNKPKDYLKEYQRGKKVNLE